MRELTSSFDDVEKRLAIFVGLGAFLFSSLICLVNGADMITYVVQGTVAALFFSLVGYAYGRWLRGLVKANIPEEDLNRENIEFRKVDAEHVDETVVTPGEIHETIIEEDGVETVIPAEKARGEAFEMPQLDDEESEELPPPPPAPSPMSFEPGGTKAQDGGDLPPPPVPPGA